MEMHAVNMLEAKTQLSRLVEAIELGEERDVVIARNGRPVPASPGWNPSGAHTSRGWRKVCSSRPSRLIGPIL